MSKKSGKYLNWEVLNPKITLNFEFSRENYPPGKQVLVLEKIWEMWLKNRLEVKRFLVSRLLYFELQSVILVDTLILYVLKSFDQHHLNV